MLRTLFGDLGVFDDIGTLKGSGVHGSAFIRESRVDMLVPWTYSDDALR